MIVLKRLVILIIVTGGIISSCKKDELILNTSAKLQYSTDTITFDTIFTTIGSVTKRFKVYNPHNQPIRISEAYLKGSGVTNFRMNLDGQSGTSFKDVDIPPNDSVYVFVEVTLDPNGGNLPMVVEDEIIFNSNGNTDAITLEAFGQDVHLVKEFALASTQTWINDKPYLILKGVIVDTGQVLTIEEGVKIHFHNNATLYVWGRLEVKGTKDNPVVFEGDRFDRGNDRTAGRWGTIYFDPRSRGNTINYAVIKNPTAGIWMGRPGIIDFTPQLVLSNTKIFNSTAAHIIAYGAEISAYNCVFADSKQYGLALAMGGKYNFYHCTASIPGAFRVDAGLFEKYERGDGFGITLTNWQPYYVLDANEEVITLLANKELTEANFYNSIFWGSKKQEFVLSDNKESEFNYFLDHCILRQLEDSININDAGHFNNLILNEYPKFKNDSATEGKYDLRLDTLSPAKDAGSMSIIDLHPFLEYDLEGNQRTQDGKPDLGAYERIE